MKFKKALSVTLLCTLLISSNAFATGGSKQPTRPSEAEVSMNWYNSLLDFFNF